MSQQPREEFIPSGSFRLTDGQELSLIALLGSCIGLVLVDRNRNIAGIYHILLASPPGAAPPGEELKFATTGLPLFLDTLIQAGAQPEHLEASLAGGALIGPVSFYDMELDIGGRTAESVREFLRDRNILLLREETGGCSPMRLCLGSSSLAVSITLEENQSGTDVAAPPPPPTDRKTILAAVQSVKPIPQIALKIMRLLRESTGSLAEISKEIEQDQVLGAKVLHRCNSPVYGLRHRVSSLERAVLLLGEVNILEIVLAATIENFFSTNEGGYSLVRGGLHLHSQAVAETAKIIAQRTGKAEADIAFTAGLLHDIGKIVLDQHFRAAAGAFYKKNSAGPVEYIDIERQQFGMDHQEIGALLAETWHLPADISTVVRWHHAPDPAKHDPLVSIVHLADHLVSRFMTGVQRGMAGASTLPASLSHLGMAPADLTGLIAVMPWQLFLQGQTD